MSLFENMTKKKHSGLFQGIRPPRITPLLSNYQLDIEGLHRLLSHIMDDGMHGIVGSTDTSIEESLNLASIAYNSGAVAVAATPSFYFQVIRSDLIDDYNCNQTLADGLPLPLFLYNIPFLTKINIRNSLIGPFKYFFRTKCIWKLFSYLFDYCYRGYGYFFTRFSGFYNKQE